MQPIVSMRNEWTVEDLHTLDVEDWRRFEIVDGSLLVSPAASADHELASEEVRAALRAALDRHLVVIGPMGVVIGRSYLIPDLVVAVRSRLSRRPNLDPSDVLIAVEVVSPASRTTDRITKPAQYAAAGIAYLWRVETDPVSLSAYELPEGGTTYQLAGTWSGDEIARIERPFPVTVELARLVP